MRRVVSGATLAEATADSASAGSAGQVSATGSSRAEEPMRTEFPFVLPRGYVDASGTVHKHGVMRLATARDELVPLRDDRVRENSAYLTVVLLARVITRIGTIEDIHTGIVEDFFASDLAFLQDLYRRVNAEGHTRAELACPACSHEFTVDLAGGRLGES
jgi:hypothetical protein